MADTYWTVTMEVVAFDSNDEAQAFAARLLDAFAEVEGADQYGAAMRCHEDSTTPETQSPARGGAEPGDRQRGDAG